MNSIFHVNHMVESGFLGWCSWRGKVTPVPHCFFFIFDSVAFGFLPLDICRRCLYRRTQRQSLYCILSNLPQTAAQGSIKGPILRNLRRQPEGLSSVFVISTSYPDPLPLACTRGSHFSSRAIWIDTNLHTISSTFSPSLVQLLPRFSSSMFPTTWNAKRLPALPPTPWQEAERYSPNPKYHSDSFLNKLSIRGIRIAINIFAPSWFNFWSAKNILIPWCLLGSPLASHIHN